MKGPSVALRLITLGRPIFVSSWGLGIGSGESEVHDIGPGFSVVASRPIG